MLTTTGYDDQINTANAEWFSNIQILNEEIYKYKVIYLYRNPIDCIYSRLTNEDHLINIQCENPKATISDCIEQKADLFGIDNFFTNYTTTNSERNYNIYCVKYEDLWTNMQTFNRFLFIPDIKDLYPEKKETKKEMPGYEDLEKIYEPLLKKMKNMSFIEIR
jgi:hypothetical protein